MCKPAGRSRIIRKRYGVNDFAKWLANDSGKTQNEQKTIIERIVDFINAVIDKISAVLKGSGIKSTAARTALEMEEKQAKEIRTAFLSVLENASENYKSGQKNNTVNNGGGIGNNKKFSLVGTTKDGRKIYKTNYVKGTPKSVKQNDIIKLVKNIWSKKEISLQIVHNGNIENIKAKFNPELEERSDLSKIVFGNKKGNNSEKRMTLDLSSDLYRIAEDANYVESKPETGKDNPAHNNVKKWHYFVTNLVYRDENDNDIDCYMNINVKETNDGEWFYSFAIEKGIAPQTLLAAVTDNSATIPNNSISNSDENVKNSLDVDSDGNTLSKQQQEYFKDSKVRDENGKLLVVYHGTSEDFTVFDREKGRSNMDIQGSFFSPWELDANSYKLVCYEEDDDYNLEIWSVYKLDNFDYNIHDDKENIAEIIVKAERDFIDESITTKILQNYSICYGTLFKKYSVKSGRYNEFFSNNKRNRKNSGQEITGSGISQGTRKDRSFSLDVTLSEYNNLVAENEKLKKANEYLRQEMKLTGHRNADIKACEAKARGLKKQLNSNIDTTVLGKLYIRKNKPCKRLVFLVRPGRVELPIFRIGI